MSDNTNSSTLKRAPGQPTILLAPTAIALTLPETPRPRPAPAFKMSYPPSLASYDKSSGAYLAEHYPHKTHNGIATSALVFDAQNRVLLLRRAPHDSMPGLWEPPGGAADDEDGSLFVSCARELFEEAGLLASRIVRIVTEGEDRKPGSMFTNRTGTKLFVKYAFETEVVKKDGEIVVQTDPNEHDAFVWATEEAIRDGKVEGVEGKFRLTHGGTRLMLYDAFRRRRDEVVDEATEWIDMKLQ